MLRGAAKNVGDGNGVGRRGAFVPCLPFLRWVVVLAVGVMCAGCETISYGVRITHEGATLEVSHGDGKTVLSAEQGDERVDLNFRRKNL